MSDDLISMSDDLISMSDDLISRQAVIELLINNSYLIQHDPNDMTLYRIIQAAKLLPIVYPKTGKLLSCYSMEQVGELMKEWIEQMPSVQPKAGRWIDDNCSECGQYVYHGDANNYCPNCGAKMESEGKKTK